MFDCGKPASDLTANVCTFARASSWKEVQHMYIGGGTVVLILIIVLVVFLVRR
jgi:hypothetical protein